MSPDTKKEFENKIDELTGKNMDFRGRTTKKSPFGLELKSLGINPTSRKAIRMKLNIRKLLLRSYELGFANVENIEEVYEMYFINQIHYYRLNQLEMLYDDDVDLLAQATLRVLNDRKNNEISIPEQNSPNEKVLNFCPNCGYKIENPMNFCPSCGFKFQ